MLTVTELKSFLRIHEIHLTKRLGQNHLIDARVIERVLDRAALSPEDTVVEIGAGLGALTESLARRVKQVLAVEVDRGVCELLRERLASSSNITVRCQDILTFAWKEVAPVTVVGAIPYHITSPILVSLCEARPFIRRAILILQQEVARRLLAKPGTKAYGRLSVLGQYCWTITPVMPVPRSAFFPQPAVDSACIQLAARAHPAVPVEDEGVFFRVVKAAFAQRRKTLLNCLHAEQAAWLKGVDLSALLARADLSPRVRGETLSLEQFATLANAVWRAKPLR
ncbi:MAG: ribosomal RNA small subunit methyltransferase A [Candidatus Omnitrophica bacterium]|nr:ribosomal RNA small subunit methyltransferase A [Candidatus Omnitrophota bacterium]